jgi:GH15 family glucan-1,4-alpha-glucosidase
VGNDARGQLQLDVYGEVADAAIRYVRRGGALSGPAGKMLTGLGDVVCRRWREPDEGIWEIRSDRVHHTFSKALCWVTLDRLLELHDRGDLRLSADRREKFERERQEIRRAVEEEGYDEELGSYVTVFGGRAVDASLLLLSRYSFADPTGERMLGTCALVQERLGVNGFLYRYDAYDDGLPPGEGAFGIASFWQVDCWCRQGRVEEAEGIFERVLGAANDVGLFAEEIDPETGGCLGNFPQAYTHAGLIDAALTLQAARGEAPEERVGAGPEEREELEP